MCQYGVGVFLINYVVKDMLRKVDEITEIAEEKSVTLLTIDEFAENITNVPHKKTMMRFLSQHEYTKAQLFGSCIAGTACIPVKDNKTRSRICIGFYISADRMFLIGSENDTVPLFGRLKETQFAEEMTLCGLFCRLLNLLIDEDIRYLQKTENALVELEEKLADGIRVDFDEEILPYRRKMIVFQSYYYQLVNLGMTFRSNINQMLSDEDCVNFTFFSGRAEHLHIQVQTLKDYIIQIRESYQTDIALRQSQSMNLLTVISSIFLPLSLLAGWYGMNFSNMPEFSSPYGYPAVIAVAVAIVVAEIIIFKKKNLL